MLIIRNLNRIGVQSWTHLSGLGRWCCNSEVRVQGLLPVTSRICFSVDPGSNLRSRFINTQLVCLPPVGIINYVTFI